MESYLIIWQFLLSYFIFAFIIKSRTLSLESKACALFRKSLLPKRYIYWYSRPHLSRTRISRIPAYLDQISWSRRILLILLLWTSLISNYFLSRTHFDPDEFPYFAYSPTFCIQYAYVRHQKTSMESKSFHAAYDHWFAFIMRHHWLRLRLTHLSTLLWSLVQCI